MIRGAIALILLAVASVSQAPVPAGTVDARHYDAFWLWAGVKPQPVLKQAKRIYLLQGQVEAGNPVRLVQQRPAVPHIKGRDIWMVVRVETLAWSPQIHQQVRAQLARWRAAGNHVVGIQIDFDARTRHLDHYAVFLADLRRRLPADCRLGITGLLDWSANGDPRGLDALAGTVDEIVLQIYQGRRVIPGYASYLSRLDRMKTPFRIGLLQGGEWHPPAALDSNPNFRGYVVFLQNGAAE
ncbi:DUF3142 domain-containing protein [Sphingomonas alpina]|uniref:DUF3142 domain-containing protein n=1 Tax=Sphingomonas alpina TaxID=653931 RepID=A0A7H0LPY3_9SPHN|nr:DUF3142 domain-containing protein [Sphingomonas alpina]QNQ11736.1 DUF3142 domain-containing protein [Sphingomonas alpina]